MPSSHPLKRYQDPSSPSWALVTGATNGMGYEWSRQLANLGFSLLLHGRSPEKLASTSQSILNDLPEDLKGKVEIKTLQADAASTPPDLAQIITALSDPTLKLRIVVNNIGITNQDYPLLEDVEDENLLSMVALNMVFPSLLAKRTLPHLKRNGPSLLINTASLGAWAPSPYLSVYSGSKAYNLQFSRALYNEMVLENAEVDVVAMVPGTVISGMNDGPPTSMLPLSSDWVSAAISSLGPSLFSSRPPPVIVPWTPHSRAAKFLNLIPTSLGDRLTRGVVKSARDKKIRDGGQGK